MFIPAFRATSLSKALSLSTVMNPLPFWMGRGGRRGFSLGVHGQPGWRSGTDSMSLILLIPVFPFTMMTAFGYSS